jgi:hypothetical protein
VYEQVRAGVTRLATLSLKRLWSVHKKLLKTRSLFRHFLEIQTGSHCLNTSLTDIIYTSFTIRFCEVYVIQRNFCCLTWIECHFFSNVFITSTMKPSAHHISPSIHAPPKKNSLDPPTGSRKRSMTDVVVESIRNFFIHLFQYSEHFLIWETSMILLQEFISLNTLAQKCRVRFIHRTHWRTNWNKWMIFFWQLKLYLKKLTVQRFVFLNFKSEPNLFFSFELTNLVSRTLMSVNHCKKRLPILWMYLYMTCFLFRQISLIIGWCRF